MFDPNLTIEQRISDVIRQEVNEYRVDTDQRLAVLDAFQASRCEPFEIMVNFSGGVRQKCWAVTQCDGTYRVVFLPRSGYFSLVVESDLGPLDIGVHGSAIGCFKSV